MSALTIRILSAIGAAFLAGAIYFFAGSMGLFALGCTVILLGIFEYINVALAPMKLPRRFIFWFYFLTGSQTLLATTPAFGGVGDLGVLLSIFISGTLWINKDSLDNEQLWRFLGIGTLGFVYFGVFAASAISLLGRPSGDLWFGLLLSLVFAGDIFAYFGGKLFGRKKLMAKISPNKTLAGSLFGLAGSVTVSAGFGVLFLPQVPLTLLMGLGFVAGLVAQSGDLFVSLLKRVAQVKDTGNIMPGHGGVLDRLDGVILAGPIVYIAFIVAGRLI